MTDKERKNLIGALLAERAGYLARGLEERAAAVDEQLRLLGAQGETPARRATRRRSDET